jgi:hypothetical protein
MTVILQKRLAHKEFQTEVTAAQWSDLLSPFHEATRHHTANLAAHGWDVILLDPAYLFVGCQWYPKSDCYFFTPHDPGTRKYTTLRQLSPEEHAKLYPTKLLDLAALETLYGEII